MTRRDHQEGSLGGWLWASWRAGRAGRFWASYAWTWTWTWSLQLSEAPATPSTEGVGLLLHIPPEGQSRLLEDPNRYCLSLKIICRYQTCRSSRYVFSLSPTSAIQIIRCLLNSLYVWCYLFWQSSSDLLKTFFPHLWNKEENILNHCLAELLQI